MVNQAEGIEKRNMFADATTGPGVVISAARVPAVVRDNVDFSRNMAEAMQSGRNDGDGVVVMVDTDEAVHLYI